MSEETKQIERYSEWLDTKFRIPGTRITFGLDFIIGLFPVVGDIFSFGLSGGLLIMMVKKGASGKAIVLMIINIVIDTLIGGIPFLGDIFDLFFKANKRNLDLFQAHFEEGRHQGSGWSIILAILVLLLVLFAILLYLVVKIAMWTLNLLF